MSKNPEVERFLILLKSQKGVAAAAICEQILAAPGIFSFGEVLSHPNIQGLKGTSHAQWLNALELFAYGTYTDYKNNSKKYPKLVDKQLTKLKQLSIVTLAAQSTTKILYYNELQALLDVKTVRQLEDMIINCIYENLIDGRLDQRKARVEINYCKGRDIDKNAIVSMKNKLLSWLHYTDQLIADLEYQQSFAKKLTMQKDMQYEDAQTKIEKTTKDILEKIQTQKAIAAADATGH